jgi:hypothetical protein
VNPGNRFGPYEVVAKLGEGGMGEVYRARDDVAPDGRFLMNIELETAAPITVVTNWNPAANK